MLREALASHRPVERFDRAIVHWLAGPTEIQLYMIPVGPGIERPRRELRAIVHGDPSRERARGTDRLQHTRDLLAGEASLRHERQTLARVGVDQGSAPAPPGRRSTCRA